MRIALPYGLPSHHRATTSQPSGWLTGRSRDTSASSSNLAAELQLWDTGNLALVTENGVILWQSFSSPTNRLLPRQSLTRNTKLVSSRSQTNYTSGFYKLLFENDSILRLIYDGPNISSIYWPDPWLLSWQVGSRKRSGDAWIITWVAFLQPCKVHAICGANSICTNVPKFGRKCFCIPGYKMINHSDWTQGCEPDFKLSCAISTTESAGFAYLPRVEFYGVRFMLSCVGFHYKYDSGSGRYNCYPKLQLRNGYHTPDFNGDIYLKLPKTILSTLPNTATNEGLNLGCSASSNVTVQLDRKYEKTLLIMLCENSGADTMQGYVLAATGFKKFSYAELKAAPRGFSEEIGNGAGGVVYRAILSDNRVAAVKKLRDTRQGEVEFLAEHHWKSKSHELDRDMGILAEGKHSSV
ncbi:hypothetical protein TIFTF001_052750 [Ficus carica]|uniref:Protein kinase domain-containing protein n=1 Tax=Ficus carica TaxID=3494 RepID=A0AA88ECN8_FICCA|nr:hypothetical protein TIFTF001_052750 [Ficus carica]